MRRYGRLAFVVGLLISCGASSAWSTPATIDQDRSAKHQKIFHAAGWTGAGAVAGHFVGPAGSAAVGTARYRHELAHNRTRGHAMVKIGAPIAAFAWGGPIGLGGYEAFDHRRWIKHHVLGRGDRPAPTPQPAQASAISPSPALDAGIQPSTDHVEDWQDE
jgi:hypothetical protein